MKSAIMPTRVRIDSVCGSVIRICAEVARRASSRSYRAETHEHGFRHAPYRKNRNEPGRANMLPRARPDNILNLPRSERVGGKRHDRLFASRHACRERLRSEEHTSELQSPMRTSYAVFCLKKKKKQQYTT